MNKRKNNIVYLIALYSVVLLGSCSEWLDINKNPDVPQDEVSYKTILPAGISSVAYVMGGRYEVLGALWSQHWTQSPGASQYQGIDSYDINSSTFDDNQFGELYSGALQNLEYVRIESQKAEQWNYYLIATVMQAYTFQVLADLYNEIPFSQALKGDNGIKEPFYEKGSDIYDSLIARIDYALSKDYDNDSLAEIGNEDILFDGDIDSWVAFANTLKLKIFLRQSEARPEIAEAGIKNLYENEAEFLNTDAKIDFYKDESGKRNPLYETEMNSFGKNPNLILSHTLYSYLLENGDFFRLDYLFSEPSNGGAHKALEQGNYYAPDEESGINSSSYSKPWLYPDDNVYFISYSESCFLQVEAIIRYKTDDYEAARDLYNAAVKNCFNSIINRVYIHEYGEIMETDSKAEAMLGSSYAFPSEGSSVETFIESIITQKWIALSGTQNLETFFEHNRTHYPAESNVPADDNNYVPGRFTISVNNVTSNRFPKRLIFPASEYASNRHTPEKQDVWVKVWWDTKID